MDRSVCTDLQLYGFYHPLFASVAYRGFQNERDLSTRAAEIQRGSSSRIESDREMAVHVLLVRLGPIRHSQPFVTLGWG